jgi:triosephosphate isomerase
MVMKTYIVGNWKLNFTVGEASIYLHKLLKALPNYRDTEVVVAPSTIALQPLSLQVDRHKMKLAVQNAFYRDYGAFTGETSFSQLRGLADYAIIGHSERRYIFREDDKMVAKKVAAAIRNKITPILCIGETESERAFGETADVIRDQLIGGLSEVSDDDLDKVIVAYEPVWAISSTKAAKLATPDEIAEVVKLIRKNLSDTYGEKHSEQVPVLFGGSVNPSNAGAYLTVPGVNGLLIGGASLILSEFTDIIETAKRVRA